MWRSIIDIKGGVRFQQSVADGPSDEGDPWLPFLLRSQEDSQPTRKPSWKQGWQQGQQPPRQRCIRLWHFRNPVRVLRRGDCPSNTQTYAPSRFSAIHSQAFQNPHTPEEVSCQQIGKILKEIVQLVLARPFLEHSLFKFERCKICRNYCEILQEVSLKFCRWPYLCICLFILSV